MAHPLYHARSSARQFGGVWEDYLTLHSAMDYTKSFVADCRHRLFTHNAWGIYLMERVYGVTWQRGSDGVHIPTRTLLEQHVIEDFGFIPTLERCFRQLPLNDEETAYLLIDLQEQEEHMADHEHISRPIHAFLDWPYDYLPDQRMRRLLHNTWGVHLAVQILGEHIGPLSTRAVAEEHIRYELGHLPTLEACLEGIQLERKWMCKGARQLSQEFMEEHHEPTTVD